MKTKENQVKKRSQKDYNLAFKLQLVGEIERVSSIFLKLIRSTGYKVIQQLQNG